WTWYSWKRLHEALSRGEWSVRLAGPDLTWWEVHLGAPDACEARGPDEQEALIDEVSLRTAQRLASLILTWLEMPSWHGRRTSIITAEEESAFTYDDVMSHVVRVRVAEQVIRTRPRDYEQAVTAALEAELQDLQVLSRRQGRHAAEFIRGEWWDGRM